MHISSAYCLGLIDDHNKRAYSIFNFQVPIPFIKECTRRVILNSDISSSLSFRLIKAQAEYAYIYNFWDALWVCFLIFLLFDNLLKIGAYPKAALYSINILTTAACQSCTIILCIHVPGAQGSAEWIRQLVKYLIELGLHHTISADQATVNQSSALPVVSQLSIHFDLREFGL